MVPLGDWQRREASIPQKEAPESPAPAETDLSLLLAGVETAEAMTNPRDAPNA
jgi:hypothetical protein